MSYEAGYRAGYEDANHDAKTAQDRGEEFRRILDDEGLIGGYGLSTEFGTHLELNDEMPEGYEDAELIARQIMGLIHETVDAGDQEPEEREHILQEAQQDHDRFLELARQFFGGQRQ